jgi:hypothetical protein
VAVFMPSGPLTIQISTSHTRFEQEPTEKTEEILHEKFAQKRLLLRSLCFLLFNFIRPVLEYAEESVPLPLGTFCLSILATRIAAKPAQL